MKAMKVIIAVLVVVILGLAYWSSLQAGTITKTRKTLAKVRQTHECLEIENKKYTYMRKKQLKALAKEKSETGGWNGPGWYYVICYNYSGKNCTGKEFLISARWEERTDKESPFHNWDYATFGKSSKYVYGGGPYKTYKECKQNETPLQFDLK